MLRAVGAGRWDFAVELESLRSLGLTNTVLRLLERQGCAEHASETTTTQSSSRSFRPAGHRIAVNEARVVLTAAGAALAREWIASVEQVDAVARCSAAKRGLGGRPRWNNRAGELWFAGELVKRLTRPAENQRLILQAFEEERWPRAIDDPLHVSPNIDSTKRLRNTIDNLNRHMLRPFVRFSGTGNGTGISWEGPNRIYGNSTVVQQ